MIGWVNHNHNLIVLDQQRDGSIAGASGGKDDSRELWVLLSPDVRDNTKSDHLMWQENSSTQFLFSASSFFHLS